VLLPRKPFGTDFAEVIMQFKMLNSLSGMFNNGFQANQLWLADKNMDH
jgi:hypothetical protein